MKEAQTLQEALNTVLNEAQAWKDAALAAQDERDALAAQVELLKPLARRCLWVQLIGMIITLVRYTNIAEKSAKEAGVHTIDQANALLDATPAQCLAEIRAEAIEDAANYLGRLITAPAGMYTGATGRLLKYAESIRKGGAK